MIALLTAGLLLLLPADDEIVATAGPHSFDRQTYADWLVDSVGYVHLEDFVLESVLVIEAEARGLRPTNDELEEAFQRERQDILDDFFEGSEQRYVDDKRARGVDVVAHEDRRRRTLLSELCLVRLAQADRVVTEEQLQQRFKIVYGELGERVELEVLFYSLYHDAQPGQRPDLVAADRDAMARADSARQRLLAGETVATLLPSSDPIQSDYVEQGHIAQWRKKLLGTETEQAVNSLDDAGQVSLPVKVWDGYYVLRLVAREPLQYEHVRDEMERMEREAYPTAEQLSATRSAVKELYPTELLLR